MVIKWNTVYFISWDPNTRMTPEESLQHEWIKEGLVHKRKEQHGSKHKHHTPATADSEKSTDPYKVPAQPVKGKKPSKFCQLKTHADFRSL